MGDAMSNLMREERDREHAVQKRILDQKLNSIIRIAGEISELQKEADRINKQIEDKKQDLAKLIA